MKNNKNKKTRLRCPNIEGELRAICVPCNNSNLSHIKSICEKALISFRHYRDVIQKTNEEDNKNHFKHFPITDVCSACREAIITSINYSDGTQLFILGINCLQQILIPGLLDTFHKITILAVLNEVSLKVTNSMKVKNKNSNGNFNYYYNFNIGYNGNVGRNNSNNNIKGKNTFVSGGNTSGNIVSSSGGGSRSNSVLSCSNSEKEQILLKVIQTSLLFLNPEIIEFNEVMITLLVSIISSFFNISGYYQLAQMSHLAIRQLVNLSLDYIHLNSIENSSDQINGIVKEINEVKITEKIENENEESFVVALLLIKDISIMIDKQVVENVMLVSNTKYVQETQNKSLQIQDDSDLTPLSLLRGGITIPPSICLDIWNEILDQNNVGNLSNYNINLLLENNNDLKSLINNVLFPSLTRCIQNSCKELNTNMSQSMYDFVMFARYIRLFIKILEYNVCKNFNGPYIKDCICNIILSFIKTISVDNISNIPSWSLQCILEMFGEIIQNPDILLIIGNINIKNYCHSSNSLLNCEFKSENLLNNIIDTLNQILLHLSDQLELLQSNENTFNLSVPSFLNEKINLPSILLPQQNNTNIECGYFIIASSKKNNERNLRLIDIIMEDDRIYHISKYNGSSSSSNRVVQNNVLNRESSYNLGENGGLRTENKRNCNSNNGSNDINNADCYDNINLNAQYCSSIYSVVLVSLKPIEISLLIFDIIVNLTSCLNQICDKEEIKSDFENIIVNVWDPLYQLLKQCMNYHLLRYYIYRIITFLYKISSITCPKLRLNNILNIIYESMQVYYNNSQLVEVKILSEPILIEKIFSLYKCYFSICHQYCEYLDETCWQFLFRYMEYIDKIIDIGLGSKIKTNVNSGDTGDVLFGNSEQAVKISFSSPDSNTGEPEVFEFDFKVKDEKLDVEHLTKTLVAESTILRVSHQVFLSEQIKKLSQDSIYSIIKGIYQELNYNINKHNFEIRTIEYLLTTLSNIIKCIYDQMSYELFIPIWNDRIIPLLYNIIKLNNGDINTESIDTAKNSQCEMAKDISTSGTTDIKRASLNSVLEDNREKIMQVFNSIMNFLSVTITTIFVYIDKDNENLQASNNNIQTSLLNPYLMFANSFPIYNTILVRSLYSILCSVIPKLDESTWILMVVFINSIIENKYHNHIKYLNYDDLTNKQELNLDYCLPLINESKDDKNNVDEDIDLFQSLFLLIEFLCDETEISNSKFISSSWNILIESIAVFGRMNSSIDNIAFQAVSLLWKLTDLIGTKLVLYEPPSSEGGSVYYYDNFAHSNYDIILSKKNIVIYRNSDKNIFLSNYVHIDIIWLNIILQLEDLCKDSRQETRNCALKSLYTTLIKHYKNVIRNDLLQVIIKRTLQNVLVESYNQYLNSIHAFRSGKTDGNLNHDLFDNSLDFEFEQELIKYNNQRDRNNHLCNSNTVNENSDSNSETDKNFSEHDRDHDSQLSCSFSSVLNKKQYNQSWEETLGITIDGTLRIIKELSLSNTCNNNIYYECSLFLIDIISPIILVQKNYSENNGNVVDIGKEVQIVSVKVLYELICVSLKNKNNELWDRTMEIYSNLVKCLLFQSYDTLNRLKKAEEYINKKEFVYDQANEEFKEKEMRAIMYRNYNLYVNKLAKYYLSDKLAETILQTVVDIINLITNKDDDNMETYTKFKSSHDSIFCLLDMIIVVITSTNTFIHNTIPIENAGKTIENGNETNKDQNDIFSIYKYIWGKGFFENNVNANISDLFIPKLVNYDKDRGLSSINSSNLVFIENYNNSDFIHKNYYKNLRNVSLLNVLPGLIRKHDFSDNGNSSNKDNNCGIDRIRSPNVVHLLRNIRYPNKYYYNGTSFSYYNKCKESIVGNTIVAGDNDKGGGKSEKNLSYMCSIKSSNDFLSSGINTNIRFITTVQTMGLEAMQYYLNVLPAVIVEYYSSVCDDKDNIHTEDSTLNQLHNLRYLIPNIIKVITDSLIVHAELFKDTCKIGLSCKTISLLVGFCRNTIIDAINKISQCNQNIDKNYVCNFIRKILINRESLVSQLLETLPYIFNKLLSIISIDIYENVAETTGIWIVAKEALLIMIQDWLVFLAVLDGEKVIDSGIICEFNVKMRNNFWPLTVSVIISLMESQSFIYSNKFLKSVCNSNASNIYERCLYFDIFTVNISFDLIQSLHNQYNNVFNIGKESTARTLIIPEKYYIEIISSLDKFISNINMSNFNSNSSKSYLNSKFQSLNNSNGAGSNCNYQSFNINAQTLEMYIIERLFEFYDTLPHTNDVQICNDILPILYVRIGKMFKNFSMEDLQSGLRPLPQLKIDEIYKLISLTTNHFNNLININQDKNNTVSEKSSLNQLLVNVLPGLIECITCKDQNIRQNIKNSLKDITRHLSFGGKRN
ncbi:hypothetical protein FG379_003101 [Cryptosporidium bovis]|uniref:uncharacterized protein n=1 Tax=Cryptosporidium bovis TaxID=310047 RepID=UPI003519F3A4|nr:hypothetical protein FG379_003101 [Cryptosporidium bovis]